MDERVELIPIKFEKVMQAKSYTTVVLGSEEKKFAIYTTADHGKSLKKQITFSKSIRPDTHDLIHSIFKGLEIKLKQIVIYKFDQTLFEARLFIEQQCADTLKIVEIDARPSDCISLALSHRVPLYCTKTVFDTSIPFLE